MNSKSEDDFEIVEHDKSQENITSVGMKRSLDETFQRNENDHIDDVEIRSVSSSFQNKERKIVLNPNFSTGQKRFIASETKLSGKMNSFHTSSGYQSPYYRFFDIETMEDGKQKASCKICKILFDFGHKASFTSGITTSMSNTSVSRLLPNLKRHFHAVSSRKKQELNIFSHFHDMIVKSCESDQIKSRKVQHDSHSWLKKPLNELRKREIGLQLAKFAIISGISINAISSEGNGAEDLRELLSLNSVYEIKDQDIRYCRATLSKYVSILYAATLQKVLEVLFRANRVHLQFDFWTTKKNRTKFGTCVATMVQRNASGSFKIETIRLGLKPFHLQGLKSSSTAIEAWINSIFKYFRVRHEKVIGFVTDGGSDIQKYINLQIRTKPWNTLICMNHQLHNCVMRSLNHVSQILVPFYDVIKTLNRNHNDVALFDSLQRKHSSCQIKLIGYSKTRWTGMYDMLSRFIRLEPIVARFCTRKLMKTPDFQFAKQLLHLLEPLYKVSLTLQSVGMCSLLIGVIEIIILRHYFQIESQISLHDKNNDVEMKEVIVDDGNRQSENEVREEIATIARNLLCEIQTRFFFHEQRLLNPDENQKFDTSIKSKSNILKNQYVQANLLLNPFVWDESNNLILDNMLTEQEKDFVSHNSCHESFVKIHESLHGKEKTGSATSMNFHKEHTNESQESDITGSTIGNLYAKLKHPNSTHSPQNTRTTKKYIFDHLVSIRKTFSNNSKLKEKWFAEVLADNSQKMQVADETTSKFLENIQYEDIVQTCQGILSVQASSASCERDFSAANLELSDLTMRKSALTLHERLFVKTNKHFIPHVYCVNKKFRDLSQDVPTNFSSFHHGSPSELPHSDENEEEEVEHCKHWCKAIAAAEIIENSNSRNEIKNENQKDDESLSDLKIEFQDLDLECGLMDIDIDIDTGDEVEKWSEDDEVIRQIIESGRSILEPHDDLMSPGSQNE